MDDVSAAGFFLSRIADGKRYWLLLQNAKRGDWGFPKGHCHHHEALFDCALRECAEETGIACLHVTGEALQLSYQVEHTRLGTVLKQVDYFPAETEQEGVVLSKEHTAARWLDDEEALALIKHPNMQDLFKQVLDA